MLRAERNKGIQVKGHDFIIYSQSHSIGQILNLWITTPWGFFVGVA